MSRLTARFFGGQPASTIVQEADGAWRVHGETPELEQALSSLVDSLAGDALFLFTGRGERIENGWRRVTVRRRCVPGDQDYLRALADTLLRHKTTLVDRRIRGEMEG